MIACYQTGNCFKDSYMILWFFPQVVDIYISTSEPRRNSSGCHDRLHPQKGHRLTARSNCSVWTFVLVAARQAAAVGTSVGCIRIYIYVHALSKIRFRLVIKREAREEFIDVLSPIILPVFSPRENRRKWENSAWASSILKVHKQNGSARLSYIQRPYLWHL